MGRYVRRHGKNGANFSKFKFQKGHNCQYKRVSNSLENDSGSHILQRLPENIYKIAINDPVIMPSVLRPCSPSRSDIDDFLCFSASQRTTRSKSLQDQCLEKSIQGNRVIAMACLTAAINNIYQSHSQHHRKCPGFFYFPASEEKSWGLGTSIIVKCSFCKFSERYKLYAEDDDTTTRAGRKCAKVNIQLAGVLTKSPISFSDTRLLFATLDIPAISEKSLRKHVNGISKIWQEINEEQMTINAKIIQTIKKHRNTNNSLMCMTDTMYNNPPKGRYMYQPGTQCVTPLLECETSKNLVVSLTSFSQLCTKGPRCNLIHENCTANYPVEQSLAAAESRALQNNLRQAEARGLKFTAVVSDGADTKTTSKLGVEKLNCIVHMSRAQRRRISKLHLSNYIVGSPEAEKHQKFKQCLSRAISYRCTMILVAARKKFPRNDHAFLGAVRREKDIILNCFSGDHKECVKCSIVCRGSKKTLIDYLPHRQPLRLISLDRTILQKQIDFRLNETAAFRQRSLCSTNKAESLHLRCLKLNPKSKTYKKNYSYRNHSAIHSDSVGSVPSLLKLLQTKNVFPSLNTTFRKIQIREKYHALRQKSAQFKIQRKIMRKSKGKLKRMRQAMTIHGTNIPVSDEHSYSST